MKTVIEVVRRLMPDGSDYARASRKPARWTKCPWWPPDVFAVAATLVNQSGCYAQPRFSASCSSQFAFGKKYLNLVHRTAQKWIDGVDPPAEVAQLWRELTSRLAKAELTDPAWQEAAMKLLAIADEACFGVGFSSRAARKSAFAETVMIEHYRVLAGQRPGSAAAAVLGAPLLPNVTTSLCQMVPIAEACVQPKSVTSQLGCSLRSLTHNLALLPGNGEVASSWLIATDAKALANDALNVLLIPFPFVVDGSCFLRRERAPTLSRNGKRHYYFGLEQKWMAHEGEPITAAELTEHLVLPMMRRAREEVGSVNAVVFPETALTQGVADELARMLEAQPDLEFLIAGALEHSKGRLPRNQVAAYFYGETSNGRREMLHKPMPVLAKCHRWCLEESQVRRYHLGHALQPRGCYWWERIDIEQRACRFNEFRQGATLAAMVCEDLARFEPVHPIVRSVGPNIVIVLLMDGPQLKNRWPGHYAGVLADDPGSAVLTLTSLGMTRRSVPPGSAEPTEIALWKQPGGDAQELRLPPGHQGLILTLSIHRVEHTTLDGRSDGGSTRRFELSGVRPIRIDSASMGRFEAHFR